MDNLKENINKAIRVLNKGGVVIFPTDTVYGFLASAENKKAVEKIYKIKKRPKSKPLSLFVKDFKMAKEIAEISKEQEKIIKKYWPGKYTFVLKLKDKKLHGLKKDTVALRIPDYKPLNNLLKKIEKPLVQTSVNISGEFPITKIKDVIEKFKTEKRVDLIFDGGNIKRGKASKIIDLTGNKLKKLR